MTCSDIIGSGIIAVRASFSYLPWLSASSLEISIKRFSAIFLTAPEVLRGGNIGWMFRARFEIQSALGRGDQPHDG
jgi:hypothetical protein